MSSSARRSKLLPAMLISVGVAAVAGIAAVLVSGRDAIGQVIVIGILTAIGCALVMVAARFLNRREHRLAAQAAIALIVIGYPLGVLLSWESRFSGPLGADSIAQALASVFAAGIPMILMCRLVRTASARVAGICGVVLLSAAAIVMLCAALIPGLPYPRMDNLWVLGFWIELFTFPVVACLVGLETDAKRRPLFRLIGIASAAFGLASLFNTLNTERYFNPDIWFITETVICAVVGHFNLARRVTLLPGIAWLCWVTVLAVVLTGLLIITPFVLDQTHHSFDVDLFVCLIAIGGICAGCGTIALAIVAWMNRKAEHVMIAPADLHEIQLQCPACQTKQTMPLGDGTCRECGLRFLIKIDEPRCESCGYLLYRLKSDRCPECGTSINTGMTNDDDPQAGSPMTNEIRMTNVQ